MKDRFARLAALTRGAAVITLSAGAGCSNDPPPVPPMTASSVPADPPVSDAGSGSVQRQFPVPNAVHRGMRDAPATPPDGGTKPGP